MLVKTITYYLGILISVAMYLLWKCDFTYSRLRHVQVCTILIVFFLVTGTIHLLLSLACFASTSCYYDSRLFDRIYEAKIAKQDWLSSFLLKHETKFLGIMHLIEATLFFLCGVGMAIKRNNYMFYVLEKRGLALDYVLYINED